MSGWLSVIFVFHIKLNIPFYCHFAVLLSFPRLCITFPQYEKLGILKHQSFNLLHRLFIANMFIFTTFHPIFYIACYQTYLIQFNYKKMFYQIFSVLTLAIIVLLCSVHLILRTNQKMQYILLFLPYFVQT